MGTFKVRRKSNSSKVVYLFKALEHMRTHHQLADHDRLVRFAKREFNINSDEEVSEQIRLALADNLISQYKHMTTKGANAGTQTQAFRKMRDGHDWYCFECHTAGSVTECRSCWRVYHKECLPKPHDSEFQCPLCKGQENLKRSIRRGELNTLLGYTVRRLKEKSKQLLDLSSYPDVNPTALQRLTPLDIDYTPLTYTPLDIQALQEKTEKRKYSTLNEFYADTTTILHNVVLCTGPFSDLSDLARVMVRDCLYDLEEIAICKMCYYMSNYKPKDWFCAPCSPPHELVYAKVFDFPFWPAKVIKKDANKYDVRFFGGHHERAIVQREQIKEVDESEINSFATTASSVFKRAVSELQRHLEKIREHPDGLDNSSSAESSDEDEDDTPVIPSAVRKLKSTEAPAKPPTPRARPAKLAISTVAPIKPRSAPSPIRQRHRSVPKAKRKPVVNSAKKLATKRKSVPTPRNSRIRQASASSSNSKPVGEHLFVRRSTRTATVNSRSIIDKLEEAEDNDTDEVGDDVSSGDDDVKPTPAKRLRKASTSIKQPAIMKEQHRKRVTSDEGSQTDGKHSEMRLMPGDDMTDMEARIKLEAQTERDKALLELREQLKREHDAEKHATIEEVTSALQQDIERARKQVEERLKAQFADEIKKLKDQHIEQIAQTKRKQWCANCEEEAMYYCCWNTSYCTIKCQQEHWHRDHKKYCRRKR